MASLAEVLSRYNFVLPEILLGWKGSEDCKSCFNGEWGSLRRIYLQRECHREDINVDSTSLSETGSPLRSHPAT